VLQKDNDFNIYKKEWLKDITKKGISPPEKGMLFTQKLFTEWLSLDENREYNNIINLDGCGDGGIDLAYLSQNYIDNEEKQDIWYLVQGKLAEKQHAERFLRREVNKFFSTLEKKPRQRNLSSEVTELLETLTIFQEKLSENDKLVYVFATTNPLSEENIKTLSILEQEGINKFGDHFSIEHISIKNIYDQVSSRKNMEYVFTLEASLLKSSGNMFLGSIKLFSLYEMMHEFYIKTADLDSLYEKNVRLYLGKNRKVNKSIAETLKNNPEKFALYNNGITLVVSNIIEDENNKGVFYIKNPSIVNGCQSSRSIYDALNNFSKSGGNGSSSSFNKRKEKLEEGAVLIKIVALEDINNTDLLKNITRYTNSQNAVREKDFLSLETSFDEWKKQMAHRGVFLEIQPGSWVAYKASQKRKKTPRNAILKETSKISDLIKIYAAGWFGYVGSARAENPLFLPNGDVYNEIMASSFGIDDLYASFRLQQVSKEYGFGIRRASIPTKDSRRRSKFLFYFIVIELIKFIIFDKKDLGSNQLSSISKYILSAEESRISIIYQNAAEFIDEYINEEQSTNSISTEPNFNSIDNFLKNKKLGRDYLFSPNLFAHLETYKRVAKTILVRESINTTCIDN